MRIYFRFCAYRVPIESLSKLTADKVERLYISHLNILQKPGSPSTCRQFLVVVGVATVESFISDSIFTFDSVQNEQTQNII